MIDRLLIVGLGSIGLRHLRLARNLLPKSDIRVLRHQVHDEAPELADGLFFNIEDACAFKPQAAIIASPAPFHLDISNALINIGCHLLIEKPLSINPVNVNFLLEHCRAKGSIVLVGYNLRFLRSLQKFKQLIECGEIGSVISVRCEYGHYLPSWRKGVDYRQGVSARDELGGGVLLELSHEIDYLLWIFGKVDWVQAVLAQQSDLEIDVEDTAHLILGFVVKGKQNPIIATVNLDFIRQDTTRSCTAIGKLGSLRWNGIDGTVELWALGTQGWQEVYKHQATRDESYLAEWNNFLACIEQGASPMVTGEDGLKVLHLIEAARSADKTKSQVYVGGVNELR